MSAFPTDKAKSWKRTPPAVCAILVPHQGAHPSQHGRYSLFDLYEGLARRSLSRELGLAPLFDGVTGEALLHRLKPELETELMGSAAARLYNGASPDVRERMLPHVFAADVVRLRAIEWGRVLCSPTWPAALAAMKSGLAPRAFLFDAPPITEVQRRLASGERLWQSPGHAAEVASDGATAGEAAEGVGAPPED